MKSPSLNKILPLVLTFILFLSCAKPPEGTVVTISLPKKTYKVYEPIELTIELINLKNESRMIGIYDFIHKAEYFISDEKGTKYRTRIEFNGFLIPSQYVILSKDTLMKYVTLNNYGTLYRKNPGDKMYFQNEGYFPPGRYNVFSVYDSVRSNTLSFDVIEDDETDKEILELANVEKYSEALLKYPGNYFAEYLSYWEIQMLSIGFLRASKDDENFIDTSGLKGKFENFFDNHTNSIYYLNEGFLYFYFRVSLHDSLSAANKMIELKKKYANTNIEKGVNLVHNREKQDKKSFIFKHPK